ncbi:unnamed protein product [Mytilus edulis]|uniref:Uncharacterized protein n=1 Tax=Mytilus edulis TaxID=6550 RepID=A0A8S3UB78_MYTED|nr:unnamed protein product [Mytilus edulis]
MVAIEKEGRLTPPVRIGRNIHPKAYQVPHSRIDAHKTSYLPQTRALEAPTVHDVDLFYELETQIIKYSDECPNIFVFGDFNARTAHLNDFVENDLLHDSILDRSNFVDAEASKFFRWNEEYKDMCRNALLINSDNIKSTLQNIEAESQDEMDSCVNDFTHQFIDIMAPFFQQSQKSGTEMKRNHKQHYKHIDKPWFDIQCKELYVNYCKTLSIFNGNKSKKNHIELNRVKKTYKDYERKCRLV